MGYDVTVLVEGPAEKGFGGLDFCSPRKTPTVRCYAVSRWPKNRTALKRKDGASYIGTFHRRPRYVVATFANYPGAR